MSRKRYYKPSEAEAMLQVEREKAGFVGDVEARAVRTIIETAKRNGRIGDKLVVVLPPYYIHVPDWQRRLDILKSEKIGFNYNKYKWEVPKVIFCNGKLYVADGNHRIIGAYLGNIDGVVVEIIEVSEEEAIELFLEQGIDRARMKPHDYFAASVKAGKPEYIAFKNICREFHIQIKGEDYEDNPIGVFSSLSDGVNTCKVNPEVLRKIFKLIVRLQWNQVGSDEGKAFSSKYIRIIKKLYAYYADSEKEMESILATYCSGAKWFEENAMDETQKGLFDKLSNIINVNLSKGKTKLVSVKTA